MQSTQLGVNGLRCNGCANSLATKLTAALNLQVSVSFSLSQISIPELSSAQFIQLTELIAQAGYQLVQEHVSFQIEGWSCGGCANKTKDKLLSHVAITTVEANPTSAQLDIQFIKGAVTQRELAQLVDSLGYTAMIKMTNSLESSAAQDTQFAQESNKQKNKLIISSLLTLPLVLPMLLMPLAIHFVVNPWLEFVLASIVQLYVGAPYYRGAWQSLKNKSANMDTLVALGTSAAYFYSCYLLLSDWQAARGALYFEASAVIITFVSVGKWLEHRAKYSTGQAIRELVSLTPVVAHVLKDGEVERLPITQVFVGDKVRVLAGEKIPVDGVVLSGVSDVDESLLTGESIPVTKQVAEPVIAGSINGHGILTIQVGAVGEDTSLQHIVGLVEKAQMSKAPIEKLVDQVARIFVPAILLIAMLTFCGWLLVGATFEVALINSVAVLVVACPCALGLATPAAMAVGSGVAAKHGIIIKDASALQIASKLDAVAFDKTGTLTLGKPRLVSCQWFSQQQEAKSLLASLMEQSEHPLSQAIIESSEFANQKRLPLTQLNVLAGKGITANYQQRQCSAGSLALMEALEVKVPNQIPSHCSQVYLAIDSELIAIIDLSDLSRAQSRDAISALTERNISTAMLSGDHQLAAQHIADELGIKQVFAGLKPAQKLEQLRQWQSEKQIVAMVGDGINDAPALAQSDLGIAMGSGTQVAIASAKITLIGANPMQVVAAIDIAKSTWTTIKQNLFLAFIFNGLAVPLSAMGYLSPQLAGLAMALSSITVLSNALWLKRWRANDD